MPYKTPRPTVTSTMDMYQYLWDDWQDANAVAEEMRDLILQKNVIDSIIEDSDMDKNITPRQHHSGRPGGLLEHARGLLMANPTIGVEEIDPSQETKREFEQVERILARVFHQQLVDTDFWPQTVRDSLAYGVAFIKALPLPVAWSMKQGYPARKKTEEAKAYLKRIEEWKTNEAKFPFVIMHVPRFNVLPLLDAEDNVIASFETKRVRAGILAELGSATAKAKLKDGTYQWYEELVVLEYMDDRYVSYFIGDLVREDDDFSDLTNVSWEQFRTWEHNLGRCPMVLIPGIKTGETALEDRYKSFLWDAKDSLVEYDFLMSRMSTMVSAYFLPSYIWRVNQNSAAFSGKDKPELTINLGGTTPIYSDQELEPLPFPTGLPDSDRLLSEADSNIQRHTLEDVLFGRVEGSAPAFQVNLRINVARSKLTPIAQHLAAGVTRVLDLFLRGVVSLGEEVVVDGEEITPKMAEAAMGRLRISIVPKSPIDRASDMQTFIQAQEAGLPWDWGVENILGEENPAELKFAKLVEKLEQRPEVEERLMQEAFDLLQITIEEEEFTDVSGNFDTEGLPDEMAAAIQEAQAGGNGAGPTLGTGPFPDGGAPQSTGRGLTTPNEQPQPRGVGVGTKPIQ